MIKIFKNGQKHLRESHNGTGNELVKGTFHIVFREGTCHPAPPVPGLTPMKDNNAWSCN